MKQVDLTPIWEALRERGIEPLDETCELKLQHYPGRSGPTTAVHAGYRHGRQVWLVIDAAGSIREQQT